MTDGIVDDESLYEDLPQDDMDNVCNITGERLILALSEMSWS